MRPNRPFLIVALFIAGSLFARADNCDILVPPQNATTQECRKVTFTVLANANPAPSYLWLRNGSVVASNAGPSYTTPLLSPTDNNSSYQVIVTAGSCVSTSAAAILTVLTDTVAPTLGPVTANCASNTVVVNFSELVSPASALETSNYAIPGLTILGLSLAADGKRVTLHVSPLAVGTNYTLTLNNIADLCGGNLITPDSAASFQCTAPPVILVPPTDLVVAPGTNAMFTVVASGSAPLSYRWYKDSNIIVGATNPTLVVNDVQVNKVGHYLVRVSNAAGSVQSAPATLAVYSSYQLTLPPGYSLIANQLYQSNSAVATVLPVVPDGTFLLKWLPALQSFADANFFVGGFGWLDPAMTLAPGEGAFINLPPGAPVILNFAGEFAPPRFPLPLLPGYNLVSRQNPLPGGYRDILGLEPVEGTIIDQFDAPADAYRTRTYVEGRWRDVIPEAKVGEAVWVSYVDLPIITAQPQPRTNALIGSNIVFSVGVSGTPPFRYQWRRNGVSIPSATNSFFSLPNAQITNAGLYTVAVQSGRVTPSSGQQSGKAEDVNGAVVSAPAALKFDTIDFPFGDNFASQPVVTPAQGLFTGNNSLATREAGETNHFGKRGGHSVWLAWVAPADGIATFHTMGSAFDTLLAAYHGSGFGAEAAADDDSGPSLTSRISFNVAAGQIYYLVVDGFSGAFGDFVLGWNFLPTTNLLPVILAHPQSRLVDLNTPVNFGVLASGPSLSYEWLLDGLPISGAAESNTFSLPAARDTDAGLYSVRVSTPFRSVVSREAQLQFRPSTPPPLKSTIGAADEGDPELLATDKFEDLVTAATNNNALAATGAVGLPKAVAHGFSGTQIFSTVGSTKESGEPNHAGVRGGKSEWYAYQPTNHGVLRLDTDGSNFDTVLAVYIGPGDSFSTLTNVASDNTSGSNGLTSKVVFNVTSNTIYWIAVDGVNHPVTGVAASGSVHLHYRFAYHLLLTNHSFSAASNNGRMIVKVRGTPNLAATIEGTTNLASPVWTPLFTNTTVSGSFTYTNTNSLAFTNRVLRAVNKL